MRDSLLQKKYIVYATATGQHPIEVFVYPHDIQYIGEKLAVGHAVWLKMWENERDQWGMPTDRASPTARVLRRLCEQIGTEIVKRKFVDSITFKEVEEEHGSNK